MSRGFSCVKIHPSLVYFFIKMFVVHIEAKQTKYIEHFEESELN